MLADERVPDGSVSSWSVCCDEIIRIRHKFFLNPWAIVGGDGKKLEDSDLKTVVIWSHLSEGPEEMGIFFHV